MKTYCDIIRPRNENGTRPRIYKLKQSVRDRFDFNELDEIDVNEVLKQIPE